MSHDQIMQAIRENLAIATEYVNAPNKEANRSLWGRVRADNYVADVAYLLALLDRETITAGGCQCGGK